VLFLDLDRFKVVNDSLGHRVGDALLACVAKRLQQLVRSSDLVARYGGDEFIIIVEPSSDGQLISMLDRLIAGVAEPFQVGERELYVEASIGVSTYPQDGDDADTLIRNADAAMYLAKANGRSGYQFLPAGVKSRGRREIAAFEPAEARGEESGFAGGLSTAN
jgi:diguanylate cyclase (GGDEF)-like protein